ncbi:hypothetical protein AFCDBAGC_3257 [Methylobacterium cerastii]|uniref:Uncharacterized protein n=1 Tax=Methylobacterium cerastii TaxID=932741 RepID=A0ABQ4QKQ0_9HYPH|nr:hypothetical protein [Methylobacterium cerastii]TXM71983.1 hypothetical protein FV226_13800 [Methylobacterium sp. WL12]TXN06045.1 hypothetical protein FV219_10060 [Methylobacterium sp. WL122]TXN84583.1 hypothetical protein FV234_01600 [Methylobacterium sp. WL8]GJD45385.1 hypothetical protein AFCDBAGC_3257 [Methylobacterium cerastii]
MAEAARRFRETSGSDVVRRLIARPIRLDPPHMVAAMPTPTAFERRAEASFSETIADEAALEAVEAEDADFDDEVEEDVVERLQAEMAVMKAILMAERAEAASLRARMEQYVEPEPIGAEARATRERWAGMVDRLLMSAR